MKRIHSLINTAKLIHLQHQLCNKTRPNDHTAIVYLTAIFLLGRNSCFIVPNTNNEFITATAAFSYAFYKQKFPSSICGSRMLVE